MKIPFSFVLKTFKSPPSATLSSKTQEAFEISIAVSPEDGIIMSLNLLRNKFLGFKLVLE